MAEGHEADKELVTAVHYGQVCSQDNESTTEMEDFTLEDPNIVVTETTIHEHTAEELSQADNLSLEIESLSHDRDSDSDDALLGASDTETSPSSGISSFSHSVRSCLQDSMLTFSLRCWPWRHPLSPRRLSRRRCRQYLKSKEQNYGAALCSIVSAVCLCCALVDTSWFTMRGGGCRNGEGKPVNSLGIFTFLYAGNFEHHSMASNGRTVEQCYRHGRWISDGMSRRAQYLTRLTNILYIACSTFHDLKHNSRGEGREFCTNCNCFVIFS